MSRRFFSKSLSPLSLKISAVSSGFKGNEFNPLSSYAKGLWPIGNSLDQIWENPYSLDAFHECSYKKYVLRICSKFTGENPCLSVISIKLQSNFIEIALRRGFSSVNLLHIFRTPFPQKTSGGLLLILAYFKHWLLVQVNSLQ